jgi:hypothetical protein
LVTDEQARVAAREILSRDEFTRWNQDFEAWLALLERLIAGTPDWVIASLDWLQAAFIAVLYGLGRVLAVFGVFGGAEDIVGWLAACLLAAIVIVWLWRWRSIRQAADRKRASSRVPARGHAEGLREAKALAREGRFLEAAHRVQLAVLALLIEFDWLELARSDPNRTLRQRIGDSALPERERRQLVELVDRLEALWFGPRQERVASLEGGRLSQDEDPELFEAWLSLDERIVSWTAGGGE